MSENPANPKKKFRLIAEIPKTNAETGEEEIEQREADQILKAKIQKCPECGEQEDFYYDEKANAYYCERCGKVFIPDD